jgi:hypothetical protein
LSTITELAVQLAEAIDERDTAAERLHEAQGKVDGLHARIAERAKSAPKVAKAKRGSSRRTPAGRSAKPAGDGHTAEMEPANGAVSFA